MNVVDSSAWIEYLENGPGADDFARPIEDTDALLVPAIVLYEVFKQTLRTRGEKDAHSVAVAMQQGRVVDIDCSLALAAARISRDLGLAMADSLIFATARAHGATLWTQDDDFVGLPDVRYFAKAGSP
jgi:predicted nucleic acid-binding protein